MMETGSAIAIAVVYGFLVLFITAHLIGRWQWRKRKLTRFFPHIVGDKSFKCERMRQILNRDFAFIASISPDPRLVNDGLHPSAFGGKDSDTAPCHWYRMKAFDLAADFVSTHRLSGEGKTIPLDQFLISLRDEGGPSWSSEQLSLLNCCKDLYVLARHQAGVFGMEKFEEFSALLLQIKQLISTQLDTSQHPFGRSVSNQAMVDLASLQSLHFPLTPKASIEPLLTQQKAGSKKTSSSPKRTSSSLLSGVTRKPSSANRNPTTELFPLVLDTDSQAFGRSSSPSVEMAIHSPRSVTSTNLDH